MFDFPRLNPFRHAPDESRTAARGPDFVCIGQQKAGTAFLHALLQRNADIWMPPVKELQFFSPHDKPLFVVDGTGDGDGQPEAIRKVEKMVAAKLEKKRLDKRDKELVRRAVILANDPTFENYCRCFDLKGGQKSGDITPAYSAISRKAVNEVYAVLPDAAIILLVRHPVDRFWSSFNQALRRLEVGKGLLIDGSTSVENIRSFLEKAGTSRRSYASKIYRRWSSVYPETQMLVLSFETLTRQTAGASLTLADFLGVSREFTGGVDGIENTKQDDRKVAITPEAEAYLLDYFAEEIGRCKSVFGDVCANWRE